MSNETDWSESAVSLALQGRDPYQGRVISPGRHLKQEPTRRAETREIGFLFVGALAIHASACANESAPPGMMPDSRPPAVAEIKPVPDTVIQGFDGRVEIKFDEPVNIGRSLNQQLNASPAGRYEVQVGFSNVRIEPRDPWRSAVYCFEIPEGISDLANNRTKEALGFCFSTGPPMTSTLVSGEVTDGTTGQAVSRGRVLFLSLPGDSTPYTAITDQAGEFRLPSLPPTDYWAFAFIDQNSNFALDHSLEPHDSVAFSLSGATSTATLSLSILEPDSTPPLLFVAEAVDSMTVSLGFDDFLKYVQEGASVTVTDSSGGIAVAVASVHVAEPETVRAALAVEDSVSPVGTPAPAEDSIPAAADDSLAAAGTPAPAEDSIPAAADDSLAAAETPAPAEDSIPAPASAEAVPSELQADLRPADPQAPPRAAPQGLPQGPPLTAGAADGQEPPRDLPSQTVTVILAEALREGEYRVEARGFVNVRDLTGGGDTTFVYTPPATPDTAGAVQDTTGAVQDTTGVVQDTTGAVQDTAAAVPDTVGTARDTTTRDTALIRPAGRTARRSREKRPG